MSRRTIFCKMAQAIFKDFGITTLDGVTDFNEIAEIVRSECSMAEDLHGRLDSLLTEYSNEFE